MYVIYIALVCVVAGIIFLVKSTQTEKVALSDKKNGKFTASQYRGGASPSSSSPLNTSGKSVIRTNEYVYSVEDSAQMANRGMESGYQISSEPRLAELNDSVEYSSNADIGKESDKQYLTPGSVKANEIETVLYEDPDSAINFTLNRDLADPSVFTNLRRKGSGALSLGSDSLSLRFDKTLYRFDFNRIKDIRGDKNGALIYPDNIAYPLLLIAPDCDDFSERLLSAYNQFLK